MKILKTVSQILFLSLVLVSCNNADVSLDGTLQGTIDNYSTSSFNIVKCIDLGSSNESVLGSCTPASSGKFSMTLSIPKLNSMGNEPTGVTVSDKNAQIGTGGILLAYKDANVVGYVIKTDISSFDGSIDEINGNLVLFMYADRSVTIKGSETSGSSTETYDLKLKKGWNEINFKVSATSSKSSISISSTVPSNLKWKYFSESSSQTVISKLKIKGVRF